MPIPSLLSIFVLALVGAILVRLPWLRGPWHAGVTELTARFLVPALLLGSTYRTGIPAAISWQVLCAFYLPLGLMFFLARHAASRSADKNSAAAALAATYSNTVFVGVPVLVQAFGPDSLQFAYPVIAFHSLSCFSFYHLAEAGKGGWKAALAGTLRNPIVLALLLGLSLNLAGIRLPPVLAGALDMLGAAALPCALLSLGASVALLRPGRPLATGAIAAAKLVLLPLGVWCLARLLALPPEATRVLVLLASCPVGVNAAFVVKPDGGGARLVNSAILLSSLACVATMPAWLWLLRQPWAGW
jgi:malonate transporter